MEIGMKTYFVVTGVVKNKDRILILRKSLNDKNYPGKWSFCSGFAKEFESAEDNVLREILEETGLRARITKKGKIIEVVDKGKGKIWLVVPFLCEVDSRKVKLCHENMDFRWIRPEEFSKYDAVPALEKDLKRLGLA
jgi:ADP-ribose pyrophosphatase YjhB (NUDIX family)